LTILIGESDQWHGHPLYQQIVYKAREAGLAGATVTRGLMGFGAHRRIHGAHVVVLSEDLPVSITIVDNAERIAAFLPILEELVTEGLVVTSDVQVEFYRHNNH
jgi:hypothetical protein